MAAESNLTALVQGMTPRLNAGSYVFVTLMDLSLIARTDTICEFKEKEGTTVVIEKSKADALGLSYDFVASWITLQIQSSLAAVGFTAVFSAALAAEEISCNVMAGYHHDHIFVATKDAQKAIRVLSHLSSNYRQS